MNQQHHRFSAPGKEQYDITQLRPQNRRGLALLEDWLAEPDDLGDAWWDDFERDLKQHRLSFRTPDEILLPSGEI